MAGITFPNVAGTLAPLMQLDLASERNALEREQARRANEAEGRAKEAAPHISAALAGDREALNRVATASPETAMKLAPLLERLDASKRAKVKEDAEFITTTGMAILNAPPEQQPQLYARARQEAEASGRNVSQWPTQYDPGWVKFNVDKAMPVAEFYKRSGEGVTFAPPVGGAPAQAGAGGSVIDRSMAATSTLESGGRYDAVGPVANPKGQRAYGRYQIMDFNVGPWTQEVLGTAMTPQQFLASPQAQDAVYKAKMGQYIQKYGSPEAASRAWFAGPGGMNNPNAKDVLGTTVQGYGQKFAQAYGPGATGPQIAQGDSIPGSPASGGGNVPPAMAPLRGLQLPPGARVALQGGVPIVKDGTVLYLDANGGWGAVPLPSRAAPKEPGAEKGLFGDSFTGRALTALRTLTPDQQDYAAAYAILSKPQVIPDGAGGQTVVQPMDLSMFPRPTYGAAGAPPPAGATPAGGPTPTPIPGGGTVTNIPGKGKPLDNAARDDLTKASSGVLELTELVKSFDPSFGGFILEGKGDFDNWMKRNLPDMLGGKDEKGQAQWWQRYQQFANLERNKLFGAALTPGEAAEFNKAMINPGMKPDQITANLARQRDVATKALSRIVNSMVAQGANREAIEAATGISLGDLPSPVGGVPQAAPPAHAPAPAPAAPQGPAEKGRAQFDLKKKYGLE